MRGRFSTVAEVKRNTFCIFLSVCNGAYVRTEIARLIIISASCLFAFSYSCLTRAAETISFDIAPQNASEALPAFGQQADISVVYRFEEIKGIQTNRLLGNYSIEEGAALLLKDSGLTASFNSRRHLIIKNISHNEGPNMQPTKPKLKKRGLGAAIGAIVAAFSYQATAQEDASDDIFGLEEIVVTAQRREQNLQDVPFAVSAFSEDMIAKSDVDEVASLQTLVPGLRVAGDEKMNVTLRGIGSEIATSLAEAAVPVNIDGVYMSRTSVGSSVYADLASIEVLRGPQGTLYGRNATGGTINMWTKTPDGDLNGNFSLLAGNGERIRARGAIGGSLSDTVSARIALASDDIDGYRENADTGDKVEGRDHFSWIGSMKIEPTDNLSVTLRALQSENDNSTPVVSLLTIINPASPINPLTTGGVAQDDPQNVRYDLEPRLQTEDDVYSATVELDLDGMIFKSVTAYQEHSVDRDQDSEGTSLDWASTNFVDASEAYTQEFTLTSDSDGSLDWVVGAWYFDDELEADMNFTFNIPGFPVPGLFQSMVQETEAWAVFGQATMSFADRVRLTGGLRYSSEEKDFLQTRSFIPAPAFCTDLETSGSWSNLAPKIAVDVDVNDDVLFYSSIAQGFKAGGANMSNCDDQFDEETVTAFEVGIKSDLADNSVRLNANAFYYDYSDYQTNVVEAGQPAAEILNADGAEIYGLEIDFLAQPTSGLTLSSGMSFQKSEFKDFLVEEPISGDIINLSGNVLANAPEITINLAAEYEFDLSDSLYLTVRGEHSWVDEHFLDQFNQDFTKQDSYGISNLRVILGSESGFEFHAFVNNLEDEDILRRVSAINVLNIVPANYHEPRTYGVEFKYSFD